MKRPGKRACTFDLPRGAGIARGAGVAAARDALPGTLVFIPLPVHFVNAPAERRRAQASDTLNLTHAEEGG